ncbi:MAG: tonB-system energizer ExbB [Alphaproteobacteria bacterium]|nr:tonB-system energizer ExbB [Alphaproteobacteria bacterium]
MIAEPETLRRSASQRPFCPCFILASIFAGLVMMNAARAQGELAPAAAPAAMGESTLAAQPAANLPSAASPPGLGGEAQLLPQPQITSAALSSKLPHDLSPWGMFQNAVVPVKLVMIGLAFASLITWTVWLAKSIELLRAKRQAKEELGVLARAESLAAAAKKLSVSLRTPIARFIAAAVGEAERSNGLAPEGVKDRTATLLSRIEAQAGHRILRGTGFLATIGATAPFVGLFGTVWGIMDSFIGISKTNTTNLAVVAPGIAEALLATALGLIAAIPAVVMYNAFARSITAYRAQLGDAAAEVLRHLSRDLDRESLEPENKAAMVPLRQSAE